MKYLALFLVSSLVFLGANLYAQDSESRLDAGQIPINVPTTMLDGEKVPWILLREVNIYGRRTFKTEADRKAYNRLKYNVLKVLPYAKIAQEKYEQLHRDLALTDSKKEQRKLVRQCESEIKEMFNKEIKNMSVSQGAILLKLIDRQTGNSSYEVVKELRGGVPAFFYQSLAKVFGHNLKSEYSRSEDRDIENIIRNAERGSYFYY
ncbi:DUF4294 domain-containing protein [Albibacterium indicum]|uniref:DUF4294 domain-containing protein n=1 Tax=Albibacterium indicum TaxID=2292082 RepID=UPI000E4A4AA7|nr:DUF4294 domain-containing protein [Pedobacter indicus]